MLSTDLQEKKSQSEEGAIAGLAVRCISLEMRVVAHSGYGLPAEQARDLELLGERFGVALPVRAARSRRSESRR